MADIEVNNGEGDAALNALRMIPELMPQEAAPAAPAAEGIEVDVEAPQGFLAQAGQAVLDAGHGIADGVQEGVTETLETVGWAGDELMFGATKLLTGEAKNYYIGEGWVTRDGLNEANENGTQLGWQPLQDIDNITDVSDPETLVGSISSGVSQFLVGLLGPGKAAVPFKTTTKTGQYGKAMLQGAIADFAAFDEHEARFADFLQDTLGLDNAVINALAADEDDTVLVGKAKNALEGMGLGLAADALMKTARILTKVRKVADEAGPEAAQEVLSEIADEVQLELFDEISDPNLRLKSGDKVDIKVVNKDAPADKAVEAAEVETNISPVMQDAKLRAEARQKRPDFDTAEFQAAIDREVALTRGGSIRDPNGRIDNDFFNWDKMDSDLTSRDYVNMAADAIPDHVIQDTKTFAKMNDEAMAFLSASIDSTPDDILTYLKRTAKDAEKQQAALLGGKMVMQSLGREIEQLAYKISNGLDDGAEAYAKMVRMQGTLMEVVANVKSIQKGAAQTTAAGRIRTTDVVTGQELSRLDVISQLTDEMDHAGGRKKIKDLADEIVLNMKAGNGTAGVLNIAAKRTGGVRKFFDVVNEVRINGLLSGPRTHAINAISNTIQTSLLPAERIAGAALTMDGPMMREGFAQYVGLVRSIRDGFKYAKMAGWKGRNILDPEASILEANGVDYRAITSQHPDKVRRGLINSVGTIVRLPSRALSMGDEFYKQLNYRSDLYARLSTQARTMVNEGTLKKADMAKWIEDNLQAGVGKDGTARDNKSLQFAREATFTNELRQGSFARGLQNMTNKHPMLKVIVPFVRTPTNIIVASAQRTPLIRRLSQNLSDDLMSGDPSRIASARGKLVTGNLVWGTAIYAAMEGNITGGGPIDREARKKLMETGWRPYSYKRVKADGGVEYVEYNRLDPFAMFFGIAADVAEIGGQVKDTDMDELAKAGLVAFANNVGSKTWLKGITDAAEAYANPEMSMGSYINSLTSSFLPYSALSREARKVQDPHLREVRTMLDAIKNTIPGYSEQLPAKRSMITGEPIVYPKGWGAEMFSPLGEAFASGNPIYASEWKQDLVLDELAALGEGVTGYPQRKIDGIELTPEQYSVYVELHGKVRRPSTKRTLYQELEKLFKSPMYDIDRTRATDPSDPALNARIRMTRRVMSGYREMAKRELLQRYPDLAAQVTKRREEALQQQRSLTTGITPITDLGE
jgi:hypothetical protein